MDAIAPYGERKSVVVGIDGSRASLNAARWAVAEAIQRDAVLRLVHAVPASEFSPGPPERHVCNADAALLDARDEVKDVGNSVCLELTRKVGDPDKVLIAESCSADLICIGEPAPRIPTGKLFGSTAAALLERAHCPVAIMRTGADGALRDGGVVSVVLDDQPDNDAVVHLAMQEGRLRNATVRQIDRRLKSWIRRYPDVHVEISAAGTGRQYRSAGNDNGRVQLAVVSDSDTDDMATLGMPNCHPIVGYPDSSVVMYRKR